MQTKNALANGLVGSVRYAAILNTYGNAEPTEDAQRPRSDSTRRREAAAGGEKSEYKPDGFAPGLYSDLLALPPRPAPPADGVESICSLRCL